MFSKCARAANICQVAVNVCNMSKDFSPVFIPNEPALYYRDGRLYLAFVCMTFWGKTPVFRNSFMAVFSTEPRGDITTWAWRYRGKLAGYQVAQKLGGEALNRFSKVHLSS